VSELADEEQGEQVEDEKTAVTEPVEPERDEAEEAIDEMLDAIRRTKVGELILSTVSTLASVAYGKLEAKELGDAKLAIDAMGALLPVLNAEVDDAIHRDFERALANLRVAYADAVSSAQ
jgi:hypothetical protein